jgi:predicted ABC-type exoprotein transport system permease subunit
MQIKKYNKMNFIHGAIITFVGLFVLIFGPIYVRGVLLSRYFGIIICLFGFSFVFIELFYKKNKKDNNGEE